MIPKAYFPVIAQLYLGLSFHSFIKLFDDRLAGAVVCQHKSLVRHGSLAGKSEVISAVAEILMQKLRHPIGNCFRGVCRIGGNFIDFVHIEYVGAIICVGVLHGIFVGAFLVVAVGIPCGDFFVSGVLVVGVGRFVGGGLCVGLFLGRGLLMVGLCGGGVLGGRAGRINFFLSRGGALRAFGEVGVPVCGRVRCGFPIRGSLRDFGCGAVLFCQNRRGTEVRKCHTARQQKREPALQGAFVSHTLLLLRRIGLLELLTG